MKYHYITFRSVTFAQQAERMLNRSGIACVLLRTPKWMEQQGCGYCLRLRGPEPGRGLAVLQKEGLSMGKVWVQGREGGMEVWEP